MAEYQIIEIPTQEIKFFVRRSRGESAYARLKQSIKEIGLKTPIGVRDMTDRPAKERKRPDRGKYNFELVYGQGRLQAFRELRIPKIPAVIVDVPEEEIVGRFLAENVMRRNLGWREKAMLIEYDVDTNELTIEQVANKYCITGSHAKKYLRILKGASSKALKAADEADFDMSLTEKLTTIPKEDQDVVIDVLEERQLDKSAIMHLVDEAAKMRLNGKSRPTKDALSQTIDSLNDELRSCRERFKVRRLDYALGPQHLFRLCDSDSGFVARVKEAGIDVRHFLSE